MSAVQRIFGGFHGDHAPFGAAVYLAYVDVYDQPGRTETKVDDDGKFELPLPHLAVKSAVIICSAPSVEPLDLEPEDEVLTDGEVMLWVGPRTNILFAG